MKCVCCITLIFFLGAQSFQIVNQKNGLSANISKETPIPADYGKEDYGTDDGPSHNGPFQPVSMGIQNFGILGESSSIQESVLIQESVTYDTPSDGKICYIFNAYNRQDRLFQNSGGFGSYNGPYFKDQMWRLDEDRDYKGWYYIQNVVNGGRIASHDSNLFTFNDGYYDDQLWKFVPKDDGYLIYNKYRQNYRIASHPNKVFGYNGPVYADQIWKLVSPFTSTGFWNTVKSYTNTGTLTVPWSYEINEGFSSETTSTIASENTFSTTVSASIGVAIDVLNIGAEASTTITNTVQRSLSRVTKSNRLVKEKFGPIMVEPGITIEILQASASTVVVDGATFTYASSYTKTHSFRSR